MNFIFFCKTLILTKGKIVMKVFMLRSLLSASLEKFHHTILTCASIVVIVYISKLKKLALNVFEKLFITS